jgi:hypothetical protein
MIIIITRRKVVGRSLPLKPTGLPPRKHLQEGDVIDRLPWGEAIRIECVALN